MKTIVKSHLRKGRLVRQHVRIVKRMALNNNEYSNLLDKLSEPGKIKTNPFFVNTKQGEHAISVLPKQHLDKHKEIQLLSAPESEYQILPFRKDYEIVALRNTPGKRSIIHGTAHNLGTLEGGMYDAQIIREKWNKLEEERRKHPILTYEEAKKKGLI